jgi:PIN domain nuclease of toxin-antitoxin system
MVDEAWPRHQVAVSAISFREIGLLVEKGRIRLSNSVGNIRETLLGHGMQEIPVDGTIAMHAAALEDFHRDPTDRIIVATAVWTGHRLLTRDRKILDWSGPLDCQNARQ